MSVSHARFAKSTEVSVDVLDEYCCQTTVVDDYPNADAVINNVLSYRAQDLLGSMGTQRATLMSELNRALSVGPGVLVIQGMYDDINLLDHHNQLFEAIIDNESAAGARGDHFAMAGQNGRIWNALQKVGLADPHAFIHYYKNPLLGLVAEAWLGPYWQMTSQVNIVRPGNAPQQPHRDYHLGFQQNEIAERFPLSQHHVSAHLTLQGAVAHSSMPLESGPTLLLPYSHQYPLGYLAWRDDAVIDYFFSRAVQVALNAGDGLFFNPALFHAAGRNETSNHQRSANLLQVSSAFGRAMESIDRTLLCKKLYPDLLHALSTHELDHESIGNVVAVAADGYSFPTNLDADQPLAGLAPETVQSMMMRSLVAGLSSDSFGKLLNGLLEKRKP
jgi:ectoine hydroxylase-related dioxygenase (phytanoyl-CoA dioxygenase family)